MQAIAHSPSFAKKVGVKQSVGKDFNMADKKTRKFGSGGTTPAKPKPKPPVMGTNGLNIPKEGYNDQYERMPPKYKPPPPRPLGPAGKKGYAAGGVTKVMPTSKQMGNLNMAKGGSAKGKATAKNKAMAKGKAMMAVAMLKDRMGRAMAARGAEAPMPSAPSAPMAPAAPMGGAPGMKKGGKAKAKPFAATKFGAAMMKKSGDTEGRAMKKFAKGGGVESRGKTKAKMVKM
jgi:hypothetical protein